jgi:hypothetical protein
MSYASLEQAIKEPAAGGLVAAESRRILLDVIEGRLPITAVRHPLGFFCLPVLRDGVLGVCIHLWTSRLPGAALTTSIVHCHSWDLVSFVLYGRVTHTLFSVDDDSSGTERIFEIRSRDDVDEIVPTARLVRRSRQSAEVTERGASYRVASGQFHASVAAADGEAATLVLGRTRTDTADLTLGGTENEGHRVQRRRCDAAETSEIAGIALEHLELG